VKNIIYFCPSLNTPIGGVKIIHRHSELINKLGGNSEVFYAYGAAEQITWFQHNATIRTQGTFNRDRDFVILPESLILNFWRQLKELNVEYGIFVQNGYLVAKGIAEEELYECYEAAKYIICISEDSIRCVNAFFPRTESKIIRVIYSIDQSLFKAAPVKSNTICYMPRKMKDHSELLAKMLLKKLPSNWALVPIVGMSEAELVKTLATSKIFLAFSDFEGLPAPPLEAAFAGNVVIGYTGQGGREYWNRPVFEAVEAGDIVSFLERVMSKVQEFEKGNSVLSEVHLALYREYFSPQMEARLMQEMIARISS
jgi:hypothetical protein